MYCDSFEIVQFGNLLLAPLWLFKGIMDAVEQSRLFFLDLAEMRAGNNLAKKKRAVE